MTSWLYIMGRGHSGSTMIDAMLGNAHGIESVGELVAGMGRYDALCSCGETFADCPYWKKIRQRYEKAAGVTWDLAVQSAVNQAHLKNLLKTLIAKPSDDWVKRLGHSSDCILKAVAGTDKHIVVDSSKEVTRALFLMRFVSNAKFIQLVRHPINVLQSSYYRLDKGSGFKFLRYRFKPKRWFGHLLLLNTIGWLIGNLLAEAVRFFGKDRLIRVRYEDVISYPKRELKRIEKFIDVPLDIAQEKVRTKKAFSVGHNIGGNQMRMSGSFRFDPQKASRPGLPKRYNIMVQLICWPLLLFYGYYRK